MLPASGADAPARLTSERALGLAPELLSPGEDASFESHDGLRVSARLYLPSPELGFDGPRPLVYYVHGGPQSQERPDFAWFSMPLIQILTLEGFAVFVPNARGSTRLRPRVHEARRSRLGRAGPPRPRARDDARCSPRDERVDIARAAVVGRSYGGYMTLMLASRHPELWRAAVDMFGPYDLTTFIERIPETWKPYFALAVGDPEKDRDLLVERSPRTYIADISCPLLVIQGQNDPRVVEQESRDLVDELRGARARRRVPRLRGRGPRRAQAREPRSLLRRDRRLLLRAPGLRRLLGSRPVRWLSMLLLALVFVARRLRRR